uniref:Uncharacterized protein n=1 Tax=Astatotilapia calliptera TaxID=8154 RepID=A0AAX7SVX3_ASTCA
NCEGATVWGAVQSRGSPRADPFTGRLCEGQSKDFSSGNAAVTRLKGLWIFTTACWSNKYSGFDKYKLVVQVVIGEQRGQGVKMSSRCFWDADTDSYAEDVFMNVSALLSHNFITRVRFLKSTLIVLPQDSLFCVVAVFGSYYY